MKLIAYLQGEEAPLIRPAPAEREWMDRTPQRFAYRCLPLNIANAHGWEILCPARVRVIWQGGETLESMRIETDAPPHLRPISHFGSGVLTFHVSCLFKTEPGYDLYVSGPPNRAKHGIAALTGVVETDWSPFTFTMNWRFTAPGEAIFEAGEPYCFFFPMPRGLLPSVEPEFHRFGEAPELEAEFNAWQTSRSNFNQELAVEGSQAREEKWQRTYFRGATPSGKPAPESHRTRERLKSFKTLRKA